MKVDIQSLSTFNRLAREGAEAATASLAHMTGIDASVDVTKITLMDREEVGEDLGDQAFVGVQFTFSGELSGQAVLAFEPASVDVLLEDLLPEGGAGMAVSGVEEVGNIMMSGFIDGWADYLGTTLDHDPPTYVEHRGAKILPEEPGAGEHDQVFVFKSQIEWVSQAVNFYIYMLPEFDALAEVMAERRTGEDAIALEKLSVFNQMTRQGTRRAADNVTAMSGIETEVDVSHLSFIAVEDIPRQIDSREYVGTVVKFEGLPSGYLMILFTVESAIEVAEALMPTEGGADELTDMHKSAIEELGNIMTSGFIDGWANVLETTVDHTPPNVVHDMGSAIVDPLAARVGQHQDHAFVIEAEMRAGDAEFGCEIHTIPDEAELKEALDALLVERADQLEADVEEIF